MDDADLRARFNSIMTKGAKTNTYKFALAKFMLEYTDKFTESQLLNMAENNQSATVDYSDTAMEFLKYYWQRMQVPHTPKLRSKQTTGYVISISEEFDEEDAKDVKIERLERLLRGRTRALSVQSCRGKCDNALRHNGN